MVDRECLNKYIEFKDNCECIICGTPNTREKPLELHHYDPSTKWMSVSRMVMSGYDWGDVKDEIDKCVPVCTPCHTRIHKNNPYLNKSKIYAIR